MKSLLYIYRNQNFIVNSKRRTHFYDQFRKIMIHRKRIGYDLNVMQQYACLVINPITVDIFSTIYNCTPVDRASDSMMARPKAIHFNWLWPVARYTGAELMIFFCFRFPVVLFGSPGISNFMQHVVSVKSSSLLFHSIKT